MKLGIKRTGIYIKNKIFLTIKTLTLSFTRLIEWLWRTSANQVNFLPQYFTNCHLPLATWQSFLTSPDRGTPLGNWVWKRQQFSGDNTVNNYEYEFLKATAAAARLSFGRMEDEDACGWSTQLLLLAISICSAPAPSASPILRRRHWHCHCDFRFRAVSGLAFFLCRSSSCVDFEVQENERASG